MKLVCWNVLLTNSGTDVVRDFVVGSDADVIALQELSENHVAALRMLDGYELCLAEDCIEKGQLSYLGLLSRVPVFDSKILTHNAKRAYSPSILGRTWRWQECLQSLSISVETSDGPVTIANVHLSCAVPPRTRRAQLEEAAAHVPPEGPAVMCGDFNSFARPAINFLAGWAFGFGVGDLLADDRTMIDDFACGYELSRRSNSKATLPRFGLHLDHILTRGFGASSVQVSAETYGSDHRPLCVELSVGGRERSA